MVSRDRIINSIETSWLLRPNGILTWAEIGTESVQAKIKTNEKDNFTVVTAVIATSFR
jgi:hypothetical protein